MIDTKITSRSVLLSVIGTGVMLLLLGSVTLALAEHENADGDLVYGADLTGAAEVPPVSTDTDGSISLIVDEEADEARFDIEVENGEDITQAHLHCAPEDENGPVFAFLFGEIPGGFDVNGTLASFTLTNANILQAGEDCPTPITDIDSLITAIDSGEVYANVHSVAHPAGVVRGQLEPVPQDEQDEDGDEENGEDNGNNGDDNNDDEDDDGNDELRNVFNRIERLKERINSRLE